MSPLDSGSDSLIGQTLDARYQVEARIGRGGMGDVYLARHLLLGSKVALKVLASDRAGDPDAARRFVREARSAFRIDHPHCVRVLDLGSSGAALYIAMEYLDGRTVGDELRADGPIESGRAAHIGAQVAAALAHAHGLGLAHRDLKPENIMLVRRGGDPDFVKVLDFGLARVFDERAELALTAISLAPLTRDGMVFGTPEYMSPEQAAGSKVGPQADVYALGAVLYHMIAGEPPFGGLTFTEILSRHVREAPVPPSQRAPARRIAPALDRLVLECLAKPEAARPDGARALGARLEAIAREGRGARAASQTSAADTADLEASGVERAASAPPAAAAPETVELAALARTAEMWCGAGPSAPGGAGAEDAGPAAPRGAGAEDAGPAAPRAAGAEDARPLAETDARARPTIRSEVGPVRRRGVRVALFACAGAGLGAALALGVVAARSPRPAPTEAARIEAARPETSRADAPGRAATPSAARSPADRANAPDPSSAGPPAAARSPADRANAPDPSSARPPSPTVDEGQAASTRAAASSAPAAPSTERAAAASGPRAASRARAARHVRAAEAARRAGNLLRQLAEADQARRLDPRNRRAALLMGEALVKSGDRANGCPLLRRSARLYRESGCAN